MEKYIGTRSGGKNFDLIVSLQKELQEKIETISTLEEQINWVERANKRLRKKLDKYKKVFEILENELELGLNINTEKFMIDDTHYFETNYYYIVHNGGNKEITYLEYDLLKEVLKND